MSCPSTGLCLTRRRRGSGACAGTSCALTTRRADQLASDHAASELNLGFLTHPSADGHGEKRGEGAELRTDGIAVVRAAIGMMLSRPSLATGRLWPPHSGRRSATRVRGTSRRRCTCGCAGRLGSSTVTCTVRSR
ncbi:type VI secretion system Vgr family protein [Paraburkholderia caffeinilytica]|uniref:type VI secretion system Vgr family protein n=1 Tax=Paraburkholderia caffeinilytica TaxID=1761016 RepID=UPI003DA02504